MRVYYSLDDIQQTPTRRRGVSVGIFDGVHLGHAKILATLKEAVRREGLDSQLVVTFEPHPLAVVRPERAPRLILTLAERIAALERLGLGELLVLDFTPELAATSHEDFARDVLVGGLGTRALVAGYDFHLGQGRRGSAEDMARLGEELGFRVEVVTPCYLDGMIVSSTRIRTDLAAGRMAEVARALGRPYSLSGEVVRGRGAGRGLSFPTANLAPPPEKALPPPGVYQVLCEFGDEKRHGLLNLGWAPTLKGEFGPEVHLLDFEGDLYGKQLELQILQWIRPEMKFSDPGALAEQIRADIERVREILAAGGGEE